MRLKSNIPSKISILRKDFHFIISIACIVICAIASIFFVPPLKNDFDLYNNGVKIEADVIEKNSHIKTTSSGSDKKPKTYYKIKYAFLSSQGLDIVNEIELSGSQGKKIKEGGTVKVLYEKSNAQNNKLYSEVKKSISFKPIFIIFPLFGVCLLLASIYRANRIIRIFETGTPAKATVKKINITRSNEGIPTQATVYYTFQYKGSQQHKGKSTCVPAQKLAPYVKDSCDKLTRKLAQQEALPRIAEDEIIPNSQIDILYNPKNPKETVWIDGHVNHGST